MRKRATIATATCLAAGMLGGLPDAAAAPVPHVAAADDDGRMMLVLDSSGSMKEPAAGGQTKIHAARQALGAVIEGLPDEAVVGLRVFGATVFSENDPGACQDTQRVVEPAPDNRAELREAVRKYRPYGETPIPAALRGAANDLGSEGQRSIVLLSDGESTCQPHPCQVAAQIAAQGIGLHIDVIGLSVSGQARQQLRCIADRGNGTYYDARNAADIEKSLVRIRDRALRPFTFAGKPVDGADNVTEAPTVTTGTYLDTLPADAEISHYVVDREIDGSTIHAGLSSAAGDVRHLGIELQTRRGDSCGTGTARSPGSKYVNSLTVGAVSSTDARAWAEKCADADSLVLKIEQRVDAIGAGTKVELVVVEEPPLASRDGLVEPEGDVVWVDMPSTGRPKSTAFGSSFADAVELDDGSYRATLVPGEAQVFKVPLDWGQSLQAEARFHAMPELKGRMGHLPVRIEILNPYRAGSVVSAPTNSRGGTVSSTSAAFYADERSIGAMTRTVRWLNREGHGEESNADLAGYYYVVVTAGDESDRNSYLLDYDLVIKRTGSAGEGAPDYGSHALEGGQEQDSDDAAADDEGGIGLVEAVAVGTLGVLALAVLVLAPRVRPRRKFRRR